MKPIYMRCSRCGVYAGHWVQHCNQDTHWSVCVSCVAWMVDKARNKTIEESGSFYLSHRPESREDIKFLYGMEGINWGWPAGTQIISLRGEWDDDDGMKRETSPNARGEIRGCDMLSEPHYEVVFENGTTVRITPEELSDETCYKVWVNDES